MKNQANEVALFFAMTVVGVILFIVVAPSASALRAGWLAIVTAGFAFAFMRSLLRYLRPTN